MNIVTTILYSLIVCVILLWIRWRKRKMSLFQRYLIPGPKPNFFIGNFTEFNRNRDRCMQEWLQQYGKIFGFYLGAKPYLVCADIEFLKLCQIKDNYYFYNKDWVLADGGIPHHSYRNVLGVLTDQKWKNIRSILNTCFSTAKLKTMSTLMPRPIKIFLNNIKNHGDQPFNIGKMCKNLVFEIHCLSSFGVNTNVQNNESNTFIESAHVTLSSDHTDILAGISVCFPEVEPICRFLRHKIDSLKYMMNLPSLTMIYETCKKIITCRKKLEERPRDLLQTLIDAEDDSLSEMKRLSDEFVISNTLLFMAAGYDTTSVLIQWCIYHLARNPEIQEKVREEIKNNVSDDVDIQYSDLSNFQLLDQVISETHRLHPLTAFTVNRVCSVDYRYKNIIIPKGSIIIVPLHELQNDPAYWSEPDKFNPYRFSSGEQQKIDSIIYQPFGVGHRICIGQRLAKTITRLVLANLLRSFKLENYGDDDVEKVYSLFVIYPKNGVTVKATPLTT
ncbi:cytochrome P450 3A8-like [Centruroides sculpturatus]|uniref:cytochrome P450 3A8-like n=1 Tax=Centruroides sculpturatus TaxID=218467 RepID=UPI000C6DD577|nr:cytochrome P450 3A8-like [Centruroides sculpturatus]XP_023237847.1 cytochrome P450 3A8-like [Centruroides sculpturatus]